jgi:hypothetical protein
MFRIKNTRGTTIAKDRGLSPNININFHINTNNKNKINNAGHIKSK